jgi:hypothetical protein
VDSKNAFNGISSRGGLTWENVRWNGMALSRENAHVDREAAQETEMLQNIPIPNTSNEISGQICCALRENARTDEPLETACMSLDGRNRWHKLTIPKPPAFEPMTNSNIKPTG